MQTITITINGKKKKYKKGITIKEIVEGLNRRDILAATLNDSVVDLSRKVTKNSEVELISFNTHEGKEVFHHSTAHVLAQAVLRLFPKAKLTIGPTIEGGYYYDIDMESLKPSNLDKIEKEMQKIVDENYTVKRHEVSKKKALSLFKGNKYKEELINEIEKNEKISYYEQGEFIDLCRGPHVPSTGVMKAFKLTKISSAYWRGDNKNTSLQRIYGTSFPDKKDLRKFEILQKEAEKRDHRKIGKELEWFMFHEYSPGSVFFHPKGTIIYNELMSFLREEYKKRGYNEVITPLLYEKSLWETSGHWDHFRDDMFILNIDGRDFALKPMNCPSHCIMYLNSTKSYRDLPLKIADFTTLHRNELRGVLSGLTRVRKMSQDDSHIFCSMEQVESEMEKLLEFVHYVYKKIFKMDYHLELSTRPEKAMGSKEMWNKSEAALENALKKNKLKYQLNPGDGAFYGPKIDLHVKDSLGRDWQCATIQLDFNLPQRFKLSYEGKDGKKHAPVMIHRAILGSLERFIGILIEHYSGRLPTWLAPTQVAVLTVANKFEKYAKNITNMLEENGVRVEYDDRNESIGKKVRDAQIKKINYIIVIGEKESKKKVLAIRTANKVDMGVKPQKFLDSLLNEIKLRS